MPKLASLLVMLLLSASLAFGQGASDYSKVFDQGVADLRAGRHDAGIAAFQRCIELLPQDPSSAYNIACGYVMKAEPNSAFQWLDQSIQWGFGNEDGPDGKPNSDVFEADGDLAPLRGDARWAPLIQRMRAMRAALESFRGEPAVYVPKALEGRAEVPLLVVLHGDGATKNQIIEGRWRKLADELGTALVAPSGRLAKVAADPAAGMRWTYLTASYGTTYARDSAPVVQAVEQFRKAHPLDASRVFLAGEGQGALVAYDVATREPALYRGVLVINGVVHARLTAARVPAALSAGLRVHALLDRGALGSVVTGVGPDVVLDSLARTLAPWKQAATLEVFGGSESGGPGAGTPSSPAELDARILGALRAFAVPAKPAEAVPPQAGGSK